MLLSEAQVNDGTPRDQALKAHIHSRGAPSIIAATHHRQRGRRLQRGDAAGQAGAISTRSDDMLALQYLHRLPADYDMRTIRDRAARRGPLWDDTEGLAFKAFVATERGVHGAQANVYASVYLWLDAAAAARFVLGERFRSVVDSFGRPRVQTALPLAVQVGAATRARARSLRREETSIAANADLERLRADESAHARGAAARPGTVAAWSVVDAADWRLVRFTLSASEASAPPADAGTDAATQVFELLHLAAPGLATLGSRA